MRAIIPLAEGVEEMECVIILDVLRRAKIDAVAVAMADSLETVAAHGVKLVADTTWSAIRPDTFDMIVIPGGMGGTRRLQQDERLLQALRDFVQQRKPVAAICAGPLVLQSAGILAKRTVTCHPGVAAELTVPRRVDDRVVEDDGILTSQGPGTTFEFALAIIRRFVDSETAGQVAEELMLPASIAS